MAQDDVTPNHYVPEAGALERSTDFRFLHDYLVAQIPPGSLPGRQHIDPADLAQILTAINLVDYCHEEDGFRLRYRLIGSLQSHYFAGGKNVAGQYLDEFWELNPSLKPQILDDYLRAINRRGPSIGIYERPNEDFPFLGYARMVFPLARDGREIDMFIVLHAYRDPRTQEFSSRIGS